MFSYMTVPHFIHLPTSWWRLGLFLLLAIMSNASMKLRVNVFMLTYVFTFLGYIHWNGTIEHCQIVFQCDCTILHLHQLEVRAPISQHLHQHLWLFLLDYSHPNSICDFAILEIWFICLGISSYYYLPISLQVPDAALWPHILCWKHESSLSFLLHSQASWYFYVTIKEK